jgi:hypothetical protein
MPQDGLCGTCGLFNRRKTPAKSGPMRKDRGDDRHGAASYFSRTFLTILGSLALNLDSTVSRETPHDENHDWSEEYVNRPPEEITESPTLV